MQGSLGNAPRSYAGLPGLRISQPNLVGSVRTIVGSPVHSDHFQTELLPVNLNHDKVVRVIAGLGSGLHQVFEAHFARFVRLEVFGQIRLSLVRVRRGAAAPADHVVEPAGLPGCIDVPFDPMLEKMVVSGKDHLQVVRSKQRQVPLPQRRCGRLDFRAAVRTGGDGRMVKEGGQVHISFAIQALQLSFHPFVLPVIGSDVGIEREDKGVAIAERKRWITGETPGVAVRRDQVGIGRKIIRETFFPLRRVRVRRRSARFSTRKNERSCARTRGWGSKRGPRRWWG